MENNKLITISTLLERYQIEPSFIDAICDYGLVRVITIGEEPCIDRDQLSEVERMIRLHYDLEINMAGIDVIFNLLDRLRAMQDELNALKGSRDEKGG